MKAYLNYQAVTTPNGLILHTYGLLEGLRHNWTLHRRSGLDESLGDLFLVDGKPISSTATLSAARESLWKLHFKVPIPVQLKAL